MPQTMQGEKQGEEAIALHQLLLLLPAHVFLFDTEFVCRYAAPYGPHFLGRPVAELVSTRAADLFAEVLPLVPGIMQVMETGTSWAHPCVPYPAGPQGAWSAGMWQVQIQPWADGLVAPESVPQQSRLRQGRRQPAAAPVNGAVVSCQPIDAAPVVPAPAQDTGDWHAEGQRSALLLERIRTKLTVIRGNADLFQRREARLGRPRALELERVKAAVDDADRLLREYEVASRLSTRHPELP